MNPFNSTFAISAAVGLEVAETYTPQAPTPRQQLFLDLDDKKEVFYGGAAAGGKSSALLMAALEYANVANYSALLLRRTYADLSKQGALMDRAKEWLNGSGASWNEQKKTWTFPSGARLAFGYLETENDKYQYQGAEYQFCVMEGTPVLMADGSYKTVEAIRTGDLVQTLEGARRVLNVFESRTDQCVQADVYYRGSKVGQQIHPVNHPVLIATGEWASYADMYDVSRLYETSVSRSRRLVHRFSYLWQQKCPSVEQRLSYLPDYLRLHLSRRQLRAYQTNLQDFSAWLANNQNDCGVFEGAPQESGPLRQLCVPVRLHAPSVQSNLPYPLQSAERYGAGCDPPSTLLANFQDDYPSLRDFRDAQLRSQPIHVLTNLLRSGGAADTSYDVCSTSSSVPLGCDHYRQVWYDHPYTGDMRRSTEFCVDGALVCSPVGKKVVYDLTVEGVNHYITASGIVNQNCGFDELSQFSETQYTYLFSRLRRLKGSDVPIRMRSASNPGGAGSKWVNERFIPEGFTPDDAVEEKVWTKEVVDDETGDLSFRYFVPARLDDNPHLDKAEYEMSLQELDPITRAQLRRGDWSVSAPGDILYMWSEPHVIITWSQFEAVYGSRHIPLNWKLGIFQDWGTTEGHPCVTMWFATAGSNSPLTGSVFCYRSMMATKTTASDMKRKIRQAMLIHNEAPRTQMWEMSHEASSERLEYHHRTDLEPYTLPFVNWDTGRTRGIEQLKTAITLRDTDIPHPFKENVFGHPLLYFIVDDAQYLNPKDEGGMLRIRQEAPAYRWDTPKSGEAPTRLLPYPLFNDAVDVVRSAAARYFPRPADLTKEEKLLADVPAYMQEATDEQTKIAKQMWLQREMKDREDAERRRKGGMLGGGGNPLTAWKGASGGVRKGEW